MSADRLRKPRYPNHAGLPARALLCAALALVPVSTAPQLLAQDGGQMPAGEQPADAATLEAKRSETRAELEALERDIRLSTERAVEIEANIAEIRKDSAELRQALIDSAARRRRLEADILESEKVLAGLKLKEDGIRASLLGRRAVLAEVLAALQRMGRNPPPALLVKPEDALASVRSAILLGAVVPGMRSEAERLIADLEALSTLRNDALAERRKVSDTITASLSEERRMNLLIAENDRLDESNSAELDVERRHAESLAGRSSTLEGLITSLESEITSLREAAERERAAEEARRRLSEAERERARQLAESGVPDKNRIAPAYAFSGLKQKLELPVAGDILRWFGDEDGTGHAARGMTIAASPGALVTAPADGHIVFAGNFRSYGKMIILNAGDGYHLVLSGMDEVNARQGRFVFAGEPLAVMGEKRVAGVTALALETDRPTLYIEFRKDGAPVDPRPWWAAKPAPAKV